MADETTADTAPEGETQPEATQPDAAQETPQKPDRRAEINRLLQEEGLTLKAGTGADGKPAREVRIQTLDDLTSRAQRVFGMEGVQEAAKREKAEAEKVKAFRARLKAKDFSAMDELDADEQAAAAEWYEKKLKQYEEREQTPPEVRAAQEREAQMAAKLREYETAEEARKREAEDTAHAATVTKLRDELAGVAQHVVKELKLDGQGAAGAMVPRLARVLHTAAEAGVELSPQEAASLVREDLQGEWKALLEASETDGALFDFLGPDVAKRVMREALRRRNQGAPAAPVGGATRPKPQQDNGPERGTPAYLFR